MSAQTLKSVNAETLHQWLNEESVTLIDVREVYEHNTFNIGGKLMVLSEIMYHAHEIPREGKVVLYCRKGVRSTIAIQKLEEKHGFNNLYNLTGGIEEWIRFTNNASLFR